MGQRPHNLQVQRYIAASSVLLRLVATIVSLRGSASPLPLNTGIGIGRKRKRLLWYHAYLYDTVPSQVLPRTSYVLHVL